MLTRRRLLAGSAGLGLMACSRPPSKDAKLWVYTDLADGTSGDRRGDWLLDAARSAGHDIEILDLSMPDLEVRLQHELQGELRCDVLLGFSAVLHEQLQARDLLQPFSPSWETAQTGSGSSWTLTREPVFLAYSLDAFPDGQRAPADWTELVTRPDLAGKYEAVRDLGVVPEAVASGLLYRYRQDGGRLGVSEQGWSLLRQYYQNATYSVAYGDFGRMKLGQLYLVLTSFNWWRRDAPAKDIATAAMLPRSGVPVLERRICVLRRSDRVEQATRFVEWFGSPQVQGEFSRRFQTIPVHPDAAGDPTTLQLADRFPVQQIDWTYVARYRDQWRTAVQELVR
ncbi:MAG: extracellular solute-binding protein [Actinomycetia bacterium]|nr:extracellular solute-binding protein [Actinomycetes bacterium]